MPFKAKPAPEEISLESASDIQAAQPDSSFGHANIHLRALQTGISIIGFAGASLLDVKGQPLPSTDLTPFTLTISNVVPVSDHGATAGLLSLGILSLAGLRRICRRASIPSGCVVWLSDRAVGAP